MKRSSLLRLWFERWLADRFLVRYGPVMIQRRYAGQWTYIDHTGDRWLVDATHDLSMPLRIRKESEV